MDEEKLAHIGTAMAKALDDIQALMVPNHPYRLTIILRHQSDPQGHMMTGNDDLDGIGQFLGEIITDPDKRAYHVTQDEMERIP